MEVFLLKKLGVIFGGMSTEHDISLLSAESILQNLDVNQYEIYPIYINKKGNWFSYNKKINFHHILDNTSEIENITSYLKNLDVLFPVLHGKYGEDGSIQGLFELLRIPYVGCGVLTSSVAMDKIYTKIIFEKLGLLQANYVFLTKYNHTYILFDSRFNEFCFQSFDELCKEIFHYISFPLFIKPSNSGSSVGVSRSNTIEELKNAIGFAFQYDKKILIEEEINGKEVECAVLGNEEILASTVGEIKSAECFYSYEAKYENPKSETLIPAFITKEQEEFIKQSSVKIFKALGGRGLSRVDFFIENKTEKIYINEINTLPGFTQISMYPQLFEYSGISYSKLLDILIQLASDN